MNVITLLPLMIIYISLEGCVLIVGDCWVRVPLLYLRVVVDQAVRVSLHRREVAHHPPARAHPRHDGEHHQGREALPEPARPQAHLHGAGRAPGPPSAEGGAARQVLPRGCWMIK